MKADKEISAFARSILWLLLFSRIINNSQQELARTRGWRRPSVMSDAPCLPTPLSIAHSLSPTVPP